MGVACHPVLIFGVGPQYGFGEKSLSEFSWAGAAPARGLCDLRYVAGQGPMANSFRSALDYDPVAALLVMTNNQRKRGHTEQHAPHP